jgi:hypothetical protein
MMLRGLAPRVRRMAMSARLSVYRHHQRGHDVERGHRNDQQQDQEHHALLDFHGAKEVGVAAGPVADPGVAVEVAQQFAADLRRGEQVVDLEPHAADALVHAIQLLRVGHVHQGQPGIELEHAGLENPTTRNCLTRGRMAAGVTRPCGASSVTLSPARAAQGARQLAAEHDAELAGQQGVELARFHVAAKSATLSSASGRMPRTIMPRTWPSKLSMPCCLHVGRRRLHSRMARHALHHLAPVGQFAALAADLDMRNHAEDALAQFLLEAVHHRQHDDQRRHAQRQAGMEISAMKEMKRLAAPSRGWARV